MKVYTIKKKFVVYVHDNSNSVVDRPVFIADTKEDTKDLSNPSMSVYMGHGLVPIKCEYVVCPKCGDPYKYEPFQEMCLNCYISRNKEKKYDPKELNNFPIIFPSGVNFTIHK